jgi:excisionase family DNA binding protein
MLTVAEAAELCRIPRNAAYQAIRRGYLPAHNFGARCIRVSKSALLEVLGVRSEHETGTAAFSRAPEGKE